MNNCKLGIDIGSTTVKLAVLDNKKQLIYGKYARHYSDIKSTLKAMMIDCCREVGDMRIGVSITGSGGMSLSKWLSLPFVQEVIACTQAVEAYIPDTDVVIELGGEDAKITYLKGCIEQRMNSSCAGGTGAFIDQMAALLNTDAAGLNELAASHSIIYPIASRCGVFAKTDIQPLLNEGARKEDIAASIFQAVVNQTIGGLSCGKPIRGRVAFLGGPLYFLPELRKRFICSLKIPEGDAICPENSQLYAAIGAALASDGREKLQLFKLCKRIEGIETMKEEGITILEPLFKNEEEYRDFKARHGRARTVRKELKNYKGNAYLGIDAGSTTTKAVLISEEGDILYSFYKSNQGDPIKRTKEMLTDLYNSMPEDVIIAKSSVTGYGEALIKAAFGVDIGEIETLAHFKGAQHFLKDVDFILDIGGQDMKCMRIKNGAIDSILLNEACSSGCGSFLEGFAASLDMSVEDLAEKALFAAAPVDLGTKCTVFMNSRVRQAQKEGVDIAGLSAGLVYSVVKNALYKVIRIRNDKELGSRIIVQGGTFLNNAVLRCFELITGRKALRPDIAGLMGAYGAALIARERYHNTSSISGLVGLSKLADFSIRSESARCTGCMNKCLLSVSRFPNGKSHVSGNRCEKGLRGGSSGGSGLPNLYEYKYKRTFSYKPLDIAKAFRGVIGVPRVLNMYENYPFWFTLLTRLGFRVILSAPSDKKLYERGLETIPSESVCYPAKLSHGHILDLIDKGVGVIFYPCIVYEKKEYEEVQNHYNCPVVISYPEVLKKNIDELRHRGVRLMTPFLSLDNEKVLVKRITEEFEDYQVSASEAREAVRAAFKERNEYRKDIGRKGEEALKLLRKEGRNGIILCGKPYHADPEINHGIPQLINSYGFAVLTEDSVAHITGLKTKLRVVDQWAYNSRSYRAASLAASEDCINLVQLNSFGCGLDAVTSDQIEEILAGAGKLFTMIKIDEGNNLGAAKIRIRSLIAAIREREKEIRLPDTEASNQYSARFLRSDKETHTILAPQMAPIHFELVREAARACGYRVEVLPAIDKTAVDEGLKYVNNDACYPAVIVIGQIVQALKSGRYDINKTAVILSQSGGGCRATNYMALLKLGLRQAGFPQVPVISLNFQGMEKQPGFKLSLGLVNRCIMALLYGDLFMKVLNRTRPYERFPGSAELLYERWNKLAIQNIRNANVISFRNNIRGIVRAFDRLEIYDVTKPRVGIVGEILLKYHPTGNNDIIGILEQGGAEAVVPDLMDYILYSAYNARFKFKKLGGSRLTMEACNFAILYIEGWRKIIEKELEASRRFFPPVPIGELADAASEILSLGNHTGEGWLITAEMREYLNRGIDNIVCVQPLACLPNHITAKGMFKPIKELFPHANIMAVDYDPGISDTNQQNRIRLLLSVAHRRMQP